MKVRSCPSSSLIELFHIGRALLGLVFAPVELLDELREGSQLLSIHQAELINEVNEMLEAGVQVSLR